MSSVEIINNEDVRQEFEDLDLDEMYDRISSSVSFEDLERHLGGSGSSTEVPVENGADDGIDSVELDPITGRGSFEHYEERKFYVFAFERDSLEVYMQEGVPELIPREELIGESVDGVFTVSDNGHQAIMTDFEYRSNWRNKNRNEVEAIYDAANKVYSAITADKTEVEDEGYDIDVSRVQDELHDKLNSEYGDDYRVTLEKIARIPENANSGNAKSASWGVNDVDRLIGNVDRENNRVVIEEIANHNKSSGTSLNKRYGDDS
jgi:hypothetical protein